MKSQMRQSLKKAALSRPALNRAWSSYKGRAIYRDYLARREHYHRAAHSAGLTYSEQGTIAQTRERIRSRGWRVEPREPGQVHTFAFVPLRSEHRQLVTDLHELGRVSHFDPAAHGFSVAELRVGDEKAFRRRRELNDLFVSEALKAHAERPLDWVYVYASGLEVSAGAVARITDAIGVPTVNLCMDDKQSWSGQWMGDHVAGQVGIAAAFDLVATTTPIACEWYMVEGGRAMFVPEGFDASVFQPRATARDIPISFIGAAYGFRPEIIRYLARHGVPVATFGAGWPGSSWVDDPVEIINRSRINLGFGGIGYNEHFTTLKGRDFDIPGTGGGAYLTTFDIDLARQFDIGREILCYSSRENLVEVLRLVMDDDDALIALSRRARERCLREHRWVHRYTRVLQALGVLAPR